MLQSVIRLLTVHATDKQDTWGNLHPSGSNFDLGEITIKSDEFTLSATTPATKTSRTTKRPDPLTDAAQTLVGVLENHRDSTSPGVTLSQLIDQVAGLSLELAQSALRKAPAKARIVAVRPSDPDSPLVLKEDLAAMARNEALLTSLVRQGSTAEAPVRILTELTQPLEKTLGKLVAQYWPQHVEHLPAGLAAKWVVLGKSKKKHFAIHDERFPLPEVDLSLRLITALKSQKEAGPQSYPASWPKLIQTLDNTPSDDLIRRATDQSPFASQARIVTTHDETWTAFIDDVPTIVCSEPLLQRLIHATCHADQPDVKLSTLAKQLPRDLQPLFLEHWQKRTEHLREAEFASFQPAGTAKKRDVLIRDRRFPPAELVLAEQFVKILASEKASGSSSYPMSWQRLVELAGTSSPAVRDKAAKSEWFQSRVISSFAGDPDAPMSLVGDEEILARSPGLLLALLKKSRTDDNHAIAVEKLARHKGIHPALRHHFPLAFERQISDKTLPSDVGALKIGKKWALLLMSDLIQINGPAKPSGSPGSLDVPAVVDTQGFARDFDAAFARLDGKLGLPQYASLVDLRPALKQYPREIFDRELLKLRRAGRYSLSLVEGRFGLSEDERAACLVVDHVPHLLVQQKK